jgi:hypothetical protein
MYDMLRYVSNVKPSGEKKIHVSDLTLKNSVENNNNNNNNKNNNNNNENKTKARSNIIR